MRLPGQGTRCRYGVCMAQASPYSFTERKRIRKNFGKRESVLNVPYLLTMQQDSYVAFLQKDVAPQKRKPEGLQAAFLSAFPIVSHNLSLIHISEPTRLGMISYAVFCLKKKKK